jgi:prolyl oligopeptidase
MLHRLCQAAAFLVASAGLALAAVPAPPASTKKPVTDSYFGVPVVDPYRWLEDPADAAVDAWSRAQNDYARAYLDALPVRAPLKARLAKLIKATSPEYRALRVSRDGIFAIYSDP